MVEKFFKLIHREYKGIDEAALLLGVTTLASQILAIARDRTFAHIFGTSQTLDIYNTAFRIPDIIFALVGTFISFTILIPFFVQELKKDENQEHARKFIDSMFTVFMIAMVVLSAAAYVLMPWLTRISAPGFSGEQLHTLVQLSRIMLLSPLLLGLSNLLGTVTQAFKKFFVYALSPIVYNLGIIIGATVLYPHFGIAGLAWGVVLGALMHVAIQMPVIIKHGFIPRLRAIRDASVIREVTKVSIPRTLGLSLSKITLLVLTGIATLMPEGSVSVFNFAFALQSVPLAIIGVSYSTAAFPVLVDSFTANNIREFIQHVLRPARQIIFWSLPVVVLFIVLRAQIIRVILGTGQFTWSDTRLTAAALALFVISVLAQSLILLLVRGYYAAGKTYRPFTINLISSVLTVIAAFGLLATFRNIPEFKYFLESLFRIEYIPGTEIIILPLAYSIGAWCNYAILWQFFRKDLAHEHATDHVGRTLRQSLLAAVSMGFVAYQMLQVFDNIFNINTFSGIFLQGFCSGIIGIVFGVALLLAMKNEEMLAFGQTIKKRFWKTKTLPPASENIMQ